MTMAPVSPSYRQQGFLSGRRPGGGLVGTPQQGGDRLEDRPGQARASLARGQSSLPLLSPHSVCAAVGDHTPSQVVAPPSVTAFLLCGMSNTASVLAGGP